MAICKLQQDERTNFVCLIWAIYGLCKLSILGDDFKAHLIFMQFANKLKPSRSDSSSDCNQCWLLIAMIDSLMCSIPTKCCSKLTAFVLLIIMDISCLISPYANIPLNFHVRLSIRFKLCSSHSVSMLCGL